ELGRLRHAARSGHARRGRAHPPAQGDRPGARRPEDQRDRGRDMSAPVLIVDDSLTVRMDLRETLAAAGLDTAACAGVAEARRALAENRFALVILDVLLPD